MVAKMFKIFLSLRENLKLFSVKKLQIRDEKKVFNILKAILTSKEYSIRKLDCIKNKINCSLHCHKNNILDSFFSSKRATKSS